MLPIWRDNWLFLLLDEKNSSERHVLERVLVEPELKLHWMFSKGN